MASILRSVEGGIAIDSDPMEWDVDAVVANVCNPESNLRKSLPLSCFPPQDFLETKLRENDVSGLAMLQDVDNSVLKKDFDIRSMGHRASIKRLILHLRIKSEKWRQEAALLAPDIGAQLVTREFASSTPELRTSQSATKSLGVQWPWTSPNAPATTHSSLAHGFYNGHDQQMPHLNGGSPWGRQDIDTRDQSVTVKSERADYALANQLRTIPLSSFYGCNQPGRYDFAHEIPKISTTPPIEPQAPASEYQQMMQKPPKPKRRIAPTNISSLDQSVSQNRARTLLSPPTSPDEGLKENERTMPLPDQDQSEDTAFLVEGSIPVGQKEAASASPVLEQHGVLFRDSNERKRVVPICIDPRSPQLPSEVISLAEATDAEVADTEVQVVSTTTSKNPWRSLNVSSIGWNRAEHMYLGPRAMAVDNLFYGSTKFGEGIENTPDQDNDEFVLLKDPSSSSGRSLYVNSCIKHFLQSKPLPVQGFSQQLVGIAPYKEHLIEAHRPASITVINRNGHEGLLTTRQNRADFSVSKDGGSLQLLPTGSSSSLFKVQQPSMAVDIDKDHEWHSLEKWNHVHGHDEILPLYGDSGSENEFDLDLWNEIEQESGQQTRPLGRRSKVAIADVVVESIVDSVISQFKDDWQTTQSLKLERMAWRLWARAKRDDNRAERIADTLNTISALTERLHKIRNQILKEDWSNEKMLMRQCKILQPTVHDRETARWETQILELTKPPRKPLLQAKVMSAKPPDHEDALLPPAEGVEVLESDNAYSSSNDSIEDFIVDDESASQHTVPIGEDVCMADASDHHQGLMPISLGQTSNASAKVDSQKISDDPALYSHVITEKPLHLPDVVDLTELTAEDEIDDTRKNRSSVSEPSKTEPKITAGGNISSKPNAKRLVMKPPTPTSTLSSAIVIDSSGSDISDASVKVTYAVSQKPALNNYPAIAKLNALILVEQGDRRRLLVWMVVKAHQERRLAICKALKEYDMEETRKYMISALQAWKAHAQYLRGLPDERSEALMTLSVWLISYTIPTVTTPKGIPPDDITTTIDELRDGDHFRLFYDLLMQTLRPWTEKMDQPAPSPSKEDEDKCNSSQKVSNKITSSQENLPASQSTKRKKIVRDVASALNKPRQRVYEVEESQTALEKRQNARERMQQAQDRRRRDLSLQSRGLVSQATDDKVLVNHATAEVQEPIYLGSFRNGLFLKPHQIEGLQFLWREITADHNDLQGCLLAHTMGLGKTIQVIALLVALAQAGCSLDPRIQKQVPPSLRKSRTIILCPPTLVENWNDELLRWIPDSASSSIGAIFKVTSGLAASDRLEAIRHWDERDGILLISYTLFRELVLNKKNKDGTVLLEGQEKREIRRILLERAELVIADEAHYFKNENSDIGMSVKDFKTKSRIALTGSPLANNLIEYFALINWVSPEFLGTRTEFKATYEEPIREGLDQNAPGIRYRDALKRLKRLHLEIEPKVLRADNDVLHKSLHGKQEFLVRVPLTDLQEKLYSLFVMEMSDSLQGQSHRLKSLACVAQLQLLCHHPQLYIDQLTDAGSRPMVAKNGVNPKHFLDDGAPVSLNEMSVASMTDDVDLKSALQSCVTKSKELLRDIQDLNGCAQSPKLTTALQLVELSLSVKDKVLVFSHRPAVLDYLENRLRETDSTLKSIRIAGDVPSHKRQHITRSFNEGGAQVGFVSTKAGGVGLNLYGANRVIILDEDFNPMFEQQAIGRAYRIGQQKMVFVYRLLTGGTYEDALQNQGLFKTQLAARVVDHQSIKRNASKKPGEYIFKPKNCVSESLEGLRGLDSDVLDKLISRCDSNPMLSIVQTESFTVEDDTARLTEEELQQANEELRLDRIRRRESIKYSKLVRADLVSGRSASTANAPGTPTKVGDQTKDKPAVNDQSPKNLKLSASNADNRRSNPPSSEAQDLAQRARVTHDVGQSVSMEAPVTSSQGDVETNNPIAVNKTVVAGPDNVTVLGQVENERPKTLSSVRLSPVIQEVTAGTDGKKMPSSSSGSTTSKSSNTGSPESSERTEPAKSSERNRTLSSKQSKASSLASGQPQYGVRVKDGLTNPPIPDDSRVVRSVSRTPTPAFSKAPSTGPAQRREAEVPHTPTSSANEPPLNAPSRPAGWQPSSSPVWKRPRPLTPVKPVAPTSYTKAGNSRPHGDRKYTSENLFARVMDSDNRRLKESENKRLKRSASPSSTGELQQSQAKKPRRKILFERQFKDGKMNDRSMTLLTRNN